jgi:hypothetical protein
MEVLPAPEGAVIMMSLFSEDIRKEKEKTEEATSF